MPTTNATRNGSGKPPGGFAVPQRQQSATVGSSIPVSSADNASRKKSLLPQPRTVPRGPLADLKRAPGLRQPTGNPESIKQRREESTQEKSNSTSLQRSSPGDVKEAPQTSLPSQPKAERVTTRSRSPAKAQANDTTKPSAPVAIAKQTPMLPPSRPARSTSLRQPAAPKLASSTEGKGHTRHRSQVLGTARTAATPPLLPLPSRPPEKSNVAKQSRPQFTTYQQHFSPKKEKEAPRTLSATGGKTGKISETDVAAQASRPEVAALQTELLQIYLLYSSSLEQDRVWKSAAEGQLRDKYYSVAGTYKALTDEEKYIQEQLNMKALYDWSVDSAILAENDDGSNFQTQIQSFSRVTQEVADMTAEGSGRYTLVIQAFDRWLTRVESVRASRNGPSISGTGSEEEPQFIDSLDRAWRDEVDDLTIKAELCLRELARMAIFAINEDEFCRKHGRSALVQIARRHRDILTLMVDELKAMRTIELELVNMEKAWIVRTADQIAADHQLRENSGPDSRAGIWRTMAVLDD